MCLTMSAQFTHLEVFARKGSQWRRSVREILEEAARKPWAIPHVRNPKNAARLAGPGLDALLSRHDEIVEKVRWVDGRGAICKIRMDTPTLACAVASYPLPIADMMRDQDAARACQFFFKDTIEWWRQHVLASGGEPQSVISHVDEAYPHIHLFALHPEGPVLALHPGRSAKRKAFGDALQSGLDRKAANKMGNDAYRRAMRLWQDDFWEKVGIKHGLTRRGAGKGSMRRGEYLRSKAEQDILTKQRYMLERAAAEIGVDLDQFLREIATKDAA